MPHYIILATIGVTGVRAIGPFLLRREAKAYAVSRRLASYRILKLETPRP